MATLTRTQLAALTELHHRCAIAPPRRGPRLLPGRRGYTMATLHALTLAGLAVFRTDGDIVSIVPIVATWRDAAGLYHALIPAGVENDDQAARAIITGELYYDNGQAYIDGVKPRVHLVGITADGHRHYREV